MKQTEEDINNKIREYGSLEKRLDKCIDVIADLTSNRRPPQISIPPHYMDDDLFIITTIEDAIEHIKHKKL